MSLRHLAERLTTQGRPISHMVAGNLLSAMACNLQGNQKTPEGSSHPGCDAQPGPGARSSPTSPKACRRRWPMANW